MPGPTPITATHRIEFQATIQSKLRRFHVYVNAIPGGTGPSGLLLQKQHAALANPNFEDAVDGLWNVVKGLWNPAYAGPGPALLQLYNPADGSYSEIASFTTAVIFAGAGAFSPGLQAIFNVYDLDRKKARLQLPEPDNGVMFRKTSIATLPAPYNTIATAMIIPAAATDIGNWMESRDSTGITVLISGMVGPNRRFRRERNIA